jgi:hypothetical protein
MAARYRRRRRHRGAGDFASVSGRMKKPCLSSKFQKHFQAAERKKGFIKRKKLLLT